MSEACSVNRSLAGKPSAEAVSPASAPINSPATPVTKIDSSIGNTTDFNNSKVTISRPVIITNENATSVIPGTKPRTAVWEFRLRTSVKSKNNPGFIDLEISICFGRPFKKPAFRPCAASGFFGSSISPAGKDISWLKGLTTDSFRLLSLKMASLMFFDSSPMSFCSSQIDGATSSLTRARWTSLSLAISASKPDLALSS